MGGGHVFEIKSLSHVCGHFRYLELIASKPRLETKPTMLLAPGGTVSQKGCACLMQRREGRERDENAGPQFSQARHFVTPTVLTEDGASGFRGAKIQR